MPADSSASLSPISWVAIDLTLTTSVSPVSCTRRVTMALASLASRAQCTTPPRAVTSRSSRSRCSSSRAIVERFIASPASRSCSQSSSSPTTFARFVRITCVAWPRLRRSCEFCNAPRAAFGNVVAPRRCPTPRGAGTPRNVVDGAAATGALVSGAGEPSPFVLLMPGSLRSRPACGGCW